MTSPPALDVDYDWGGRPRSPEQCLFVAVLCRAARDALGEEIAAAPGALPEAREWFLLPKNPDRRFVCEAAGVPERAVVRWARAAFPNYEPLPAPSAERAAALIRELRQHPPSDLVRWASERGISPHWALSQAEHVLTTEDLRELILQRAAAAPVDTGALARELGLPERRTYFAALSARRADPELRSFGAGRYGYRKRHYYECALAKGPLNVYRLAAALGLHHREIRALVSSDRQRGVPLVNVSPGVFALPRAELVEPLTKLDDSSCRDCAATKV